MRKFLITYVVFSVVVLVLVYLVTLIQETQKRSIELFDEFAEAAVSTRDFDDFIRYQSIGYRQSDAIETTQYDLYFYHVIAQDEVSYPLQFLIIVLPKGDVDHAQEVDDTADQTRLVIRDNFSLVTLYDTAVVPEYEDVAISYGIQRLGFYYLAITIDQSTTLGLTLYDYDGEVLWDGTTTFDAIVYDGGEMPNDYHPGITESEVNELRNMTDYLFRPMLINITLYLVIDVSMGTLFYWFLKKKLH